MPGVRRTRDEPVPILELVIEHAPALPETIREVRSRSDLGISEIRRRIGTDEPVITVSTIVVARGLHDLCRRIQEQQEYFLNVHDALLRLGSSVRIRLRASKDAEAEEVDLTRARMLLDEELAGVREEARADDEWTEVRAARQRALQDLLGPTTDTVHHAVIPSALGGGADVLEFPRVVPGATYVTVDLTGPQSSRAADPVCKHELMICTRSQQDWAPDLLSELAARTDPVRVQRSGILDVSTSVPRGATLTAVVLVEPPVPLCEFHILGERYELLLCLGITTSELAFCYAGKQATLLDALRREGVYPYSDLWRHSVV